MGLGSSQDGRDGTIFEDPTYQEFVESLAAPKAFQVPSASDGK